MKKRESSLFGALLALSLLILLPGFASAEVLTLDQSIDLALDNSPGVIGARNSYQASRAQVLSGWGSILPSISISANASRNWPGSFDVYTLTRRTDSYSGSLNFNVDYPGLGLYTYATIKRSYHERGSSFYGMASAQTALVQQVKEVYYGAVRSKMLMGVSEDAVKRSQEGLRVAQSRYDLGAASISDVLRARVQLASDQLDSVTNVNAYKSALANLAYVMGVDVNREIDVTDSLPPTQIEISYQNALNEALSQNPDYRREQFNHSIAKNQRLLAYSNLLPTLSFGLSHRTNVGRMSDLLDLEEPNASYTLYGSISFNIFRGFSDYASIRTASLNAKTSEENLSNTRNNVALGVKQAFLDLERAAESKKLSDQSAAAASEDLKLVNEKYSLGAATILDVLTSEVSFKQAQVNQVQALFDYNLAVSRLEKAMGR